MEKKKSVLANRRYTTQKMHEIVLKNWAFCHSADDDDMSEETISISQKNTASILRKYASDYRVYFVI